MDLRLGRKTLFAIALTLLISPALALGNPYQTEIVSQAEQKLSSCLELAKQGNLQAAFENAKQTRQFHSQERMFDVEILNEAIDVVNAARLTKMYDGQGDPEMAFHFMNSLGQLSVAVESVSPPIAAKLRVYEGRIAHRLRDNPSYPKNALEALAKPMVDMAQGYSHQKKVELAYQSIDSAIRCGYSDYRSLADKEWFVSLGDSATAKRWMASFDVSYQNAIDVWSQQVVREFQGANFNFSLRDLDGSTVAKRDYTGKVLVVDLWATWCPPCRKGIPDFIKLQQNHRRDGVAVLGISMDAPQTPDNTLSTVQSFVEAKRVNYDIALGDTTISSQLPGKMVLPTTLFLDRDGRVRYIARGYHDFAKVEAITRVLLKESQPISSSGQFSGQDY